MVKLKNPFKSKSKDKDKEKSKEDVKEEAAQPAPAPAAKDTNDKKKKKEEKKKDTKKSRSKSPTPKSKGGGAPGGIPPGSGAPPEDEMEDYSNLSNLGNANTYEEQSERDVFKGMAGRIPVVKKADAETNTEFPRFVFWECKNNGTYEFRTKGKEKHVEKKSITKAIQNFKKKPEKYISMSFQANSKGWPTREQEYFLIEREDTCQLAPKNPTPDGWMTVLMMEYQHLPTFLNNELPMEFRDAYTDQMMHKGKLIHNEQFKPVMPGRGMGCADTPLIKLIGDIDPNDIKQGQVGCCWLLSAISALAEFDGAVKKLFRKTKDLHLMPKSTPNMYTITLWDLPTWKEVDIIVDERLAANPNTKYSTSTVLSSKPSSDGELWVPYLEKAIAIHCGGWDAITGGQCTHAWAIMTGCKEQYIILRNPKTNNWQCWARYNPNTQQWLDHHNDIHKCDNVTGVWPLPFPVVGDNNDTGDSNNELDDERLFDKMFACDQMNYIVSAGSKGGGTDEGLVDNHAYTVIEAVKDAAGTGIDLFKVRNPWGKGEIEDGEFDDDGPGWDKYPQIKALLNPVVADDGIFWMTKQEFMDMFKSVYVSASNMTRFLED